MGAATNRLLDFILGWTGIEISESSLVGYVIGALIQVALLLNVVAVGALIFIWMERKIAGRIQDRLGPTRVGGAFGWLQTLADGIKLIAKEDITPRDADGMLFRVAPYISMGAALTAYMALPFSDGWVAQHLNSAVFFILAVLGLEVFGVILAGYASGSKWSLFGAMREAAQVVSYEVPLGMCVVIPVFICGTMNLVTIGNMQAGLFTNWLIFHDPFTFLVFWVYFTCGVASVNRAPFDLAEAESELVAGFHTEYSGLRWSFFFMAEYGSMFTVSALASILFFGAWNGPIPIFDMLGASTTTNPYFHFFGNLVGCANLLLKACVGVTVMMWVRWTLPRLRIDQVMTTCLKYCVPIAAICFLGTLGWQVTVGRSMAEMLHIPRLASPIYSVREKWALAALAAEMSRPTAAPEIAAPPEGTAAEVTPAGEQAATEKAEHPKAGAVEKEATDQEKHEASPEKKAPEKTAPEKTAPEKTAPEKTAPEKTEGAE